ncbi:phosphorylated adapter RNA export protein [Agrilus planipennis]|uniref:Phosphorylated adapter RNA export protein n=1 Tax=Agrilus planipennis TaxID=224129 RepID=A0A1W4XSE9_AGRPL|nr:phosphorylated adapter RNA export protein [Agrilus planipennis]
MELEDDMVEEGELTDDSDDCYKPLQRPVDYSKNLVNPRLPIELEQDSDEESVSSISSDSDTGQRKSKRPKLKPLRRREENKHKKKYDIWSSRAQEDLLSETLTSCDVSNVDRSRTVETYDYTLGEKLYGRSDSERVSNKRTHNDRKNPNLKLYKDKKNCNKDDKKIKGTSRTIFDLKCTSENTAEEIAKELANKLYEEKEDLLVKIVEVIGKEKVFKIFKETKRIEEDGGMLIMNQTRRRTPGGVFLFLVKHDSDLEEEQLAKIFEDEKQKFKHAQKMRKKVHRDKLKAKIAKAKQDSTSLPELLSRGELCVEKNINRTRRESDETFVKNPPPSPVTDIHENNEEISSINNMQNVTAEINRRLTNYEDEFLDLGCENNMDLF